MFDEFLLHLFVESHLVQQQLMLIYTGSSPLRCMGSPSQDRPLVLSCIFKLPPPPPNGVVCPALSPSKIKLSSTMTKMVCVFVWAPHLNCKIILYTFLF